MVKPKRERGHIVSLKTVNEAVLSAEFLKIITDDQHPSISTIQLFGSSAPRAR